MTLLKKPLDSNLDPSQLTLLHIKKTENHNTVAAACILKVTDLKVPVADVGCAECHLGNLCGWYDTSKDNTSAFLHHRLWPLLSRWRDFPVISRFTHVRIFDSDVTLKETASGRRVRSREDVEPAVSASRTPRRNMRAVWFDPSQGRLWGSREESPRNERDTSRGDKMNHDGFFFKWGLPN